MFIKTAKDLNYGDIIVQANRKWRIYTPFVPSFQAEIIPKEYQRFTTWGYHGYIEINEIISPLDIISEDELDEVLEKEMVEVIEIYDCKLGPVQSAETWDNYPFVVLEKNEYKY
jgi:hypothetical protein